MNVLTYSRERRRLLQEEIIAMLVALTPILITFMGLLESCVKLLDTIMKSRSASSKGKQRRKKRKKNNR